MILILYIVLLGFGVAIATDWYIELVPWKQRPWFITGFSLVLSALGVGILIDPHPPTKFALMEIFAIAALAKLLRAFTRLLEAAADWADSNWIAKMGGGTRRTMNSW